jgi:hypothetical protein
MTPTNAKPSRFHAPSPLLDLLDQRYVELGLGKPDYPPYRKPFLGPEKAEQLDNAARNWAKANPSDPHAGPRMRLHMMQGYELVSDVAADAKRMLLVQANARHASLAIQGGL